VLCLQEPSNETYKKALEMCKKVRTAPCCSHMPAYTSWFVQYCDMALQMPAAARLPYHLTESRQPPGVLGCCVTLLLLASHSFVNGLGSAVNMLLRMLLQAPEYYDEIQSQLQQVRRRL
jgi:hypothetical protein